MTTVEAVRAVPGLTAFLEEVEERLADAVASHPGLVSVVGAAALGGGKRLRPMLAFLSAPPAAEPPVVAAVAVELVHLATLVHDDLIDGARVRRGRAAAWTEHGAAAASATGDYLFARAFAELAASGGVDARGADDVAVLAEACLALARGEAMQRRQRHDPDTSIDDYVERCALKTGKLFEAACTLAGGSGAYGLNLGVAFQIADDILDCVGDSLETGKVPGTDLRDGTPTLPLILAARQDPRVRRALAGGDLDGALVRVAESGVLDRSREVALEYARRARESLGEVPHHDELDALADAVVHRDR